MESLLTSTAEILVIGFALLMALDFFSGLVHLYRSVSLQTQPHDEPETESAMSVRSCHKGIASSIGHLTVLPEDNGKPQTPTPLEIAEWDVVEPSSSEPATLSWLETAINPDTLDAVEQPNVIEMARSRLPLVQVFGGGQSERDLTRLGIRELKKRASAAKIKRYNVMTKTQLIDQLFAVDKLTA